MSAYHCAMIRLERDGVICVNRYVVIICALMTFSQPGMAEKQSVMASHVVVGDLPVRGKTARDGVVVSRNLTGETEAHAFTDKTVIDDVTDAGTYGAFDSVVELKGSNRQNHVYSFQDRAKYSGTAAGVLEAMGGFISRPVHAGTGKILMRTAVDLGDVRLSSTGSVEQNVGIYIRNLAAGKMNTAIVMAQSSGYGIYSSGVAPSYHRSDILFGAGSGPVLLDDPRQSEAPRDLSQAEQAVAKQLKDLFKVSRNKVSGKTHIGIQVNDIQAAFKAQGLEATDYAILENTPQGLGVRYDELLAFVVSSL